MHLRLFEKYMCSFQVNKSKLFYTQILRIEGLLVLSLSIMCLEILNKGSIYSGLEHLHM